VQQSAVDEYERCQQGSAMARQEVSPQQVDADGMRMMNNAIWIPERAVDYDFSCLRDHLNLTFIYNTFSADATLARHVVHKLQRWALKMSVFYYCMEHVMGDLNY
jgi:hypothetical protein